MAPLLPARYTLNAWSGSLFQKTVAVYTGGIDSTVRDLTGYAATMNLRDAPGDTPYYTLSTTNGQITLGGTAGTVTLFIPSTDMLTLQSGLYDLTATSDGGAGEEDPLLWGVFRVRGVS